MGWYTDKSKTWEITNSLPIYFLMVILFFCPQVPLFLMGIFSRRTETWTVYSILSFLFQWGLIWLISYWENTFTIVIFFPLAIFMMVYTYIYTFKRIGIYLQSLTEKSIGLKRRTDISKPYSNLENSMRNRSGKKSLILETHKKEILLKNTELSLGKQFINDLKHWQREVEPIDLKEDLERIIKVSQQIEERDPIQSELFFMRNTETINKLLSQYDSIENAKINSDEITSSLRRLEGYVGKIRVSFEQELINMFKSDLMDIDAESEAYLQTLKNKGLID